MYYLVYKITNLIDGKYYIGCHKTKNREDGYSGSGTLLKRAIRKYGIEYFRKEILFEASSPEEMFLKEKELVVVGGKSYNLKQGGFGGFDHCNTSEGIEKRRHTFSTTINKGYLVAAQKFRRKYTSNSIFQLKYVENALKASKKSRERNPNGAFYRKTHSEEAKRKIGAKNSKRQMGKNNSNFGNMWITNGYENRLIHKEESIPVLWRKGRVV